MDPELLPVVVAGLLLVLILVQETAETVVPIALCALSALTGLELGVIRRFQCLPAPGRRAIWIFGQLKDGDELDRGFVERYQP